MGLNLQMDGTFQGSHKEYWNKSKIVNNISNQTFQCKYQRKKDRLHPKMLDKDFLIHK